MSGLSRTLRDTRFGAFWRALAAGTAGSAAGVADNDGHFSFNNLIWGTHRFQDGVTQPAGRQLVDENRGGTIDHNARPVRRYGQRSNAGMDIRPTRHAGHHAAHSRCRACLHRFLSRLGDRCSRRAGRGQCRCLRGLNCGVGYLFRCLQHPRDGGWDAAPCGQKTNQHVGTARSRCKNWRQRMSDIIRNSGGGGQEISD